MPGPTDQSEVTASVWTDGQMAPLVQSVVELLAGEVRLVSAGGPPSAALQTLVRSQECVGQTDLRQMMVQCPADFLLLGSMADASIDDVANAADRGASVLALEPVASDLREWARLNPRKGPIRARRTPIVAMPRFLGTPGFPEQVDWQRLEGARTIGFETTGQAGQGSLFARMLDAWATVLGFSEMPQSIDAHLHGSAAQSPRRLRGLTGRLTAHARMADGTSAAIWASDRAGQTARRLNVLADGGQLLVTDTSYEHLDPAGHTLEAAQALPSTGAKAYADLVADQWLGLIQSRPKPEQVSPSIPSSVGLNQDGPLVCCLTCLLSARTGEPEAPHTLRQMQ